MPYRSPDLEVMDKKSVSELEREIERRRRNVESSRHWLRHQFERLAKQQEDLEALEDLLEQKRATLH